ncbi:MAG TPA: ribonuclease domain-containing protein [Casimicrobiaceae bacterium]|jgi:ribonuclease T1
MLTVASCLLAWSLLALAPLPAVGKGPPQSEIAAQDLPAEARSTLARIRAGGPFVYERDGVVFGNRERLLPPRARGYYHEYTVPTPGIQSRGARRIVCGGHVATVAECYYSNDHYQSFRKIQR